MSGQEDVSNDPYMMILRMASILGDFRRALLKEGFSKEEAFCLAEQLFRETPNVGGEQ
ncbi:DUF7187 family protein [Actinocorallia libanotica]|uniref:Uncharacterized protein n=1 Tax=Actinocorallia libanotica TaxID=46162 RepID=A0ABP4CGZ4_9ACTN